MSRIWETDFNLLLDALSSIFLKVNYSILILLFQAIQLITNGKKTLIYDTIVTLFCSLC